jgi:hypothetical protein
VHLFHTLGILIRPCFSHSRPVIFRGGASCGGTQLPVSPLDENSEWRCDRCPVVLTSSEVYDLVSRIGEEVDKIQAVSTELERNVLLCCECYIFNKTLQHTVNKAIMPVSTAVSTGKLMTSGTCAGRW